LREKERNMAEKPSATTDAVTRETPPKPLKKREESVLRWPSAATSAGGAYIPSHAAGYGSGEEGPKGQ
jgi:hypothetical protein